MNPLLEAKSGTLNPSAGRLGCRGLIAQVVSRVDSRRPERIACILRGGFVGDKGSDNHEENEKLFRKTEIRKTYAGGKRKETRDEVLSFSS